MGWMDQMKPADWIGLAQLGTSVAGGIAGAGSSQRAAEQAEFDRMQKERADEFARQLQYYQMQQQARSGLGAFYNQANMDRATGRQALLNASPLGAEQQLAYQMARARGLSGVAENFQPVMPTSADIAGLIRPTTNVLGAFTTPDFRQAISPEATARSIAERRKALAGVDPTFQFGSMGDYGLPNLEKEVATYAQGVAADRLGRENLLQDLLLQQTKAAAAFPQTVAQAQGMQGVPPSQTTQAQKPKKNAWWKKVLNVAATAAPIVAAPFTGGTSLALIGAGAGALKGALSGGAKGALTGAAMGAATSAIGGGAAGAAAKRGISEGVKESASAAIKRAILNPRALTQLGGAAIGGQAEQLAQMASPFLRGAKTYNPNAAYTRGLPVQAEISKPADFTSDILQQAGMGRGQALQPFIRMAPPSIQTQLTSPALPAAMSPADQRPPVAPRPAAKKTMGGSSFAAGPRNPEQFNFGAYIPQFDVANMVNSPVSSGAAAAASMPVGPVPQLDSAWANIVRGQNENRLQRGIGQEGAVLPSTGRGSVPYVQAARTLIEAAPPAILAVLGLGAGAGIAPYAPEATAGLAGRIATAMRGPDPVTLNLSRLMAEASSGSPQATAKLGQMVAEIAKQPNAAPSILQLAAQFKEAQATGQTLAWARNVANRLGSGGSLAFPRR